MRLLILVTIGALLSACSLLQAPDRNRIEPMDASLPDDADADARMDGDADADAIIDGGDSCPDGSCPMDEVCDDGIDNDLDGLIDCNDFDCTAASACCGERSHALRVDWGGDGLAQFARFPVGGTPHSFPSSDVETMVTRPRTFLSNFGPVGRSSGFITASCQSMMLGLRITTSFQPIGESCDDEACYAAVVLTGARTAEDGARLVDDLAIRMNAEGHLQVTQAWPRTIVPWTPLGISVGQEVPITIDVTPGQYRDGEPALLATVTVGTAEGSYRLLEAHPFIALADLEREDTGCAAVPGLYLGVEGSGAAVRVFQLDTYSLQCVNPSHFDSTPDGDVTLRPGSEPRHLLNLGDWAQGGMGSPALLSTCSGSDCWETGGLVRWDLFVEASNIDLESETFTHVGYSVDHGVSTAWENRHTWFPEDDDAPRLGDNPPSCFDIGGTDTCDDRDNRSVRDPAVWAWETAEGLIKRDGSGTPILHLSYARERLTAAGDVDRGRFEIHIDQVSADQPGMRIPSSDVGWIRMEHVEEFGCVSLRHPSLSTAAEGALTRDQTGFWLLYTCERDSGRPSIILTELTTGFRLNGSREVLRAEDLGPYAAAGVWGAEMVVDFSTELSRPRVRVWFMARSADRQESVGLVQGEGSIVVYPGPEEPPVLYAFPDLVEFGGNPVLDVDHDALWAEDGPLERPSGTRLLGLAVASMGNNTPVEGSLRRLRFLVARRVNRMGMWTSELVPLGQAWRSP